MTYDDWLTAPLEERTYCPHCWADSIDAEETHNALGRRIYICGQCGGEYTYALSRDEMVAEATYDAKLARAGL